MEEQSPEMCAACPLEVNGLGDDSDLIYLSPSPHFLFFFFCLAPWQGGEEDLLSWKVFILFLIFIFN